jgi:uncharacterized protein YneF (UPF0154 family)
MRNLLKGILFGLLVGVVVGWWLAEDSERREFEHDPEIQKHMAESRRMHQTERWIQELGDDEL